MASAYFANKYNLKFKVYENSNFIGGNCRTIEIDNFKFDTGAHRFHDKIPHITSEIKNILKENLLEVSSPSKIILNQKSFNFPIQFIDIIKNLNLNTILKISKENIINQFKKSHKPNNFKDFVNLTYGKTISELFLNNYTEKLWGKPIELLSPSISGGRLKNLNLKSTIKEIFYNQNFKSKHLDGSFYYPKMGFGSIFTSIEDIIGSENIFFNSPVTKLVHNNYKIEKIVINHDKIIPAKKIISTIPITSLIKILDPQPNQHIINIINNFNYRALKLCILFLDKNTFSKNASIYFPEKNIPFTRIYEPKNRSTIMAPKNKTSIIVEIPFDQNKINEWENDNELIELIISI